jgi:glyoxylase-like metal-dependent hydrolase (beta-lactamase superfamily II)
MAIYNLPTGWWYETFAVLAVRGGSFRDKRRFAASSILVRHPHRDPIIDAGFGADVATHVAMLPQFVRAPYRAGRTVSEQLDAARHDRSRLLGMLLTHSHWDHRSGLNGLPNSPIWINADERECAARDPNGNVFRRVSQGHEIHGYAFEERPYLGSASSYDEYGDGSAVVALGGGHTIGSMFVFVTLPSGRRYAFIGDLTWQIDGVRRRVERPWLLSKLADGNREQLREDLLRIIALDGLMQIVPAHDLGSYDGIPLLTLEAAEKAR